MLENGKNITSYETTRSVDAVVRVVPKRILTGLSTKVIQQLMTLDACAESGYGNLPDQFVTATQRATKVTQEAAIIAFFELIDELGQTDKLWQNRAHVFFRALDTVVTAVDEPVDPQFTWLLFKRLFAKLSLMVGSTTFHEATDASRIAMICDLFELKSFPSWHKEYQAWRIDRLCSQAHTPRGGGALKPPRAQPIPPPKGKPQSQNTPPKTPGRLKKKNPAACLRHITKMAVPTEDRCNENSCGYTHGAPWKWPRSEILAQINNFFTKPEKLALKQPVLDLVDKALTTALPSAENDAIRQANNVA